jgi:hypothetical protein
MNSRNRHRGPAECSDGIRLMASMVTGRSLSPGKTGSRDCSCVPAWKFKGVSPTTMRDFQPQPARHHGGHEMRCDNQPHRFYCGVDLHAMSPRPTPQARTIPKSLRSVPGSGQVDQQQRHTSSDGVGGVVVFIQVGEAIKQFGLAAVSHCEAGYRATPAAGPSAPPARPRVPAPQWCHRPGPPPHIVTRRRPR